MNYLQDNKSPKDGQTKFRELFKIIIKIIIFEEH